MQETRKREHSERDTHIETYTEAGTSCYSPILLLFPLVLTPNDLLRHKKTQVDVEPNISLTISLGEYKGMII